MMETAPIRVLLVDDHEMVLESLSSCFARHPAIHVVGTAHTSDQLEHIVRETQPQVVVLDLHLPGRGAFDAVADLREEQPDIKVLFLSGFLADVFVTQALRLRVNGYLMKGASVTALVDAIQRVAAGETVYAQEVESRITFDPVTRRDVAKNESDLSALTGRQLEVLRHLARGESVKEIATQMHLSQKSVDSHKYRIMNKLGIHDRVELARFAIREGLMIP
jgi:DNA-binding NarL/FixJ family response regulator